MEMSSEETFVFVCRLHCFHQMHHCDCELVFLKWSFIAFVDVHLK